MTEKTRAEVEHVETYRGYTITTRSGNREGYRILLPHGGGILDFTNESDIKTVRERIDAELDGGWGW